MTRKTPTNFALWAALPMAHTSKIERRLTTILDSTRRRTLPRRALIFGIAFTAAALMPLAMLRPVAEAQMVSGTPKMPFGTFVRIVGVKDINIYHLDHRWWQANGLLLTGAKPHAALSPRFQKDLFSSTNVKNLMFAFHFPVIHQGEDVTFAPAGSQGSLYQADLRSSVWTLESTFPLPQKTTTVKIGIATHPWRVVAAHAPVRSGDAGVASPYGNIVFSPIQHYPGNNWVVTVTTDQPTQDWPTQDWRVVAVDGQGRKFLPISFGPSGTAARLRLMAGFDKSVSSRRVRQFQVETRPFVWTEFKNVALQPVK